MKSSKGVSENSLLCKVEYHVGDGGKEWTGKGMQGPDFEGGQYLKSLEFILASNRKLFKEF